MILLFVQQNRNHGEMAFLTSRSASRHVHFARGVDPTARHAGKSGDSDLVSQATPKVCVLALRWLRGNSVTDVGYKGKIVQCVAPQKLSA